MNVRVNPDGSGNGDESISPQAEPAPTPLVSSAHYPLSEHPHERVPNDRRRAIEPGAKEIANTAPGAAESHIIGKCGEYAAFQYFGIEDRLNLEVVADGGDGGIDGWYNGGSLQVKTVGRRYANCPELWVDAYEPYSADYYILVSRVGVGEFRLIGYAPRMFVENAPKRAHDGGVYRVVDREYLFPLPGCRPIVE